ncbi:unnamed protein product, partial [marine sediment metagenome]
AHILVTSSTAAYLPLKMITTDMTPNTNPYTHIGIDNPIYAVKK